jgi:(-)-germacrene D synthase
MPEYNEELTYNSSILELAKLDFGLLQRLHLKELKALSRY